MSSFWNPVSTYQHVRINKVSPGRDLLIQTLMHMLLSLRSKKRMSFFPSLCNRSCMASMAVEASVVLPLFLFFIINILSAFEILRLHGNIMGAMHQTGNKMAFYGYAYQSIADDGAVFAEGIDSAILSEGYARNHIIELLGKEYLNHTCLSGGTAGLHLIKSSVMNNNDIIDLTASYYVKPFVSVVGFSDFPMENRYYAKAWTGFDVESRQSDGLEEDPLVYVAENGTVYHVARNCSYLNPSIEPVSVQMIAELRNESGEKYISCGSCDWNQYQAVVYITHQGNRVHGSLKCPGLRRTIYTLRLSQTAGKSKCSKCGF